MEVCPESDNESESSMRSSLTGESPITSSFQSYNHCYVPTIFEQIISSQESDSCMSVSKVVDRIVYMLADEDQTDPEKLDDHKENDCDAAKRANLTNGQLANDEPDDDEEMEDCDASSQSSNSSGDIDVRPSKKSDVAKERVRNEKLFGIIVKESVPDSEKTIQTDTIAEQLYIDQCCSWFRRTTRGGVKNRPLNDELVVEELPKNIGNPKKKKRKLCQEGGGDG